MEKYPLGTLYVKESAMRTTIIPYRPWLNVLVKQSTNNSTTNKTKLWMCLKDKQISGHNFHRQKPIDKYIIHFYCSELMLAIEVVDRLRYEEGFITDTIKEKRLQQLGITILRVRDQDIDTNLEGVLENIKTKIKELETYYKAG